MISLYRLPNRVYIPSRRRQKSIFASSGWAHLEQRIRRPSFVGFTLVPRGTYIFKRRTCDKPVDARHRLPDMIYPFYTRTRNWRSMMIHRFDWFEEPRDPRRGWPGLLKDGRSGRWAPRIVAAIHSSQLSFDLGRALSLIFVPDKISLMGFFQGSGRLAVPYVLLYYLPENCNPSFRMMYAGAVELMRSTAEVNRVLEVHEDDIISIESRLQNDDWLRGRRLACMVSWLTLWAAFLVRVIPRVLYVDAGSCCAHTVCAKYRVHGIQTCL